MWLAELEAAVGWLERHRLSEHLHLVRDDPRYAFRARRVAADERRRLADAASAHGWCLPGGRPAARLQPWRQAAPRAPGW
jgi:hypothetical protein